MTEADEKEVREEQTRLAMRRNAYLLAVMVLTVMFAAASSILVSVILTQRSERKLCAVVITSDDAYRNTPPTTPTGRVQADNFSRLRRELGCPQPKE